MGTAEELARLIADRLGQLEPAHDPADFTEPVGEVAFCFRLEPPSTLLTPHSAQPPSLLAGEFIPVRIGPAADLRR